jgi:hypothetical protein
MTLHLSIIPDIFLSCAEYDNLELLSFVKNSKSGAVFSTIAMNEYVLRVCKATNKANLKPFDEWEITKQNHIRFIKHPESLNNYIESRYPVVRPINPAARIHIQNHISFDVKKAQANYRDKELDADSYY